MTSNLRPRSIQGDRITLQEVDTETLLYDERSHKAWCLNRSSASIWRLCNGERTIAEIAAEATVELGSPVSEDLVLLTIEELREKELLEAEIQELPHSDLSRREMIARVSLTAAALLPVIAALTVSAAAQGLGGSAGSGGNGDDMSNRTDPVTKSVRKSLPG